MAWDRKVKARVTIDVETTVFANREVDARRIALEQIRNEFGPRAVVADLEITPEGDWEDQTDAWELTDDELLALDEVINTPARLGAQPYQARTEMRMRLVELRALEEDPAFSFRVTARGLRMHEAREGQLKWIKRPVPEAGA